MSVPANVITLRGNFRELVNEYRQVYGKPPLAYNDMLNNMAEMWVNTHRDEGLHSTHEHMGSTPKGRANQVGYHYDHLSENVARTQKPDGRHAFEAWRDSEDHRKNMLGPVKDLGFACVHAPYGAVDTPQYVCVAVFGSHL